MSHAQLPTGHAGRPPLLRRRLLAALTLIALASTAVAGIAMANAADPDSAAAKVKVGAIHVVDGVQIVRISISGAWQWPSQNSDCNDARTGVGYGVDWSDPDQAGNHVTTLSSGSVDIGAAAANDYNAADNAVHPTRPEESGSQFNDPGDPASYAAWRGGCGTFNGDMNTGLWGAINLTTGAPVTCTSDTSPSPTCLGGSHVYTVDSLENGLSVCAIMYDVHGQDSSAGGAPNAAKEVRAGGSSHNTDNGAEKNSSTPVGNACVAIDIPPVSPTPPATPVPTPSIDNGPTPDPSPSPTPTPTNATPSPNPTPTPTNGTPTPPPTQTPTPTPTNGTPTPPPTTTPVPTPSIDNGPTPDPSATPTPTPTDPVDPTPVPTPTDPNSPTPTPDPSGDPTPTPSTDPTPTPVPSGDPNPTPTPDPSGHPHVTPRPHPEGPTSSPTLPPNDPNSTPPPNGSGPTASPDEHLPDTAVSIGSLGGPDDGSLPPGLVLGAMALLALLGAAALARSRKAFTPVPAQTSTRVSPYANQPDSLWSTSSARSSGRRREG